MVANPVVETMEATWNQASRKAWPAVSYRGRMFPNTTTTARTPARRKKLQLVAARAWRRRPVITRKNTAKFREHRSMNTVMMISQAGRL